MATEYLSNTKYQTIKIFKQVFQKRYKKLDKHDKFNRNTFNDKIVLNFPLKLIRRSLLLQNTWQSRRSMRIFFQRSITTSTCILRIPLRPTFTKWRWIVNPSEDPQTAHPSSFQHNEHKFQAKRENQALPVTCSS